MMFCKDVAARPLEAENKYSATPNLTQRHELCFEKEAVTESRELYF